MKKVDALWLNQDPVSYDSLDELVRRNVYVGFIPDSEPSERYMVMTGGSYRGIAVNYNCTWNNVEDQKKSKGTYFIFDSAKELVDWFVDSL